MAVLVAVVATVVDPYEYTNIITNTDIVNNTNDTNGGWGIQTLNSNSNSKDRVNTKICVLTYLQVIPLTTPFHKGSCISAHPRVSARTPCAAEVKSGTDCKVVAYCAAR